jgi:hypothetical protein
MFVAFAPAKFHTAQLSAEKNIPTYHHHQATPRTSQSKKPYEPDLTVKMVRKLKYHEQKCVLLNFPTNLQPHRD